MQSRNEDARRSATAAPDVGQPQPNPPAAPRRSRRRRGGPSRALVLATLLASPLFIGAGCVKGAAGPGLRWRLFAAFGANRMCPEMLKRGVPLKLNPTGNTVGRYFPNRCSHEVNDQAQTVTLHFSGTGYAWTPMAGRVGFSANASVEYGMDWGAGKRRSTYVWGRLVRIVYGPEFQIGGVENKAVDFATRGTPVGYLVQNFGQQIVSSQLAQGFTVVHHPRRGDLFCAGLLQPPALPPTPFDTAKGKRFVFANETTEVHHGQVDFLGPFEVVKGDQTLFLRLRHGGGPAIEALVYPAGPIDVWREGLQLGAPLAAPPVPALTGFPIASGADEAQRVKLGPGLYYVVLDNSAQVGSVSPPWSPLGSLGASTAVVSYSAELADDRDAY